MNKVFVLNKGFVELISHTPDADLLIINAARASFDKEHEEFDKASDEKLINYLAKHRHVLPFRHPHITFRIYAPIFVLRQLGKHQVGFSWSEVSRRYIDGEIDFYTPYQFRKRPEKGIKQGSGEVFSEGYNQDILDLYEKSCQDSVAKYHCLLFQGVAPEMARMVLPQSMYTTTVTTGSLLGWNHMFKLRTDSHTQLETREYAEAIGSIIKDIAPYGWNALCEH